METPKPKPPVKNNVGESATQAGEAMKNFGKEFKKPYVHKPHLTQRPFRDPRLAAMKAKLQNR